jgi:reverse gyrase
LGTVIALYFAVDGEKSYIVVPTALLVQQVSGATVKAKRTKRIKLLRNF